jgi:MFS family permease
MSTIQAAQAEGGPLRALKHHNFRLFWFGQLLSLIGSWMQGLAQGWLILVLADPAAATHVLHSGGDATAAVQHASRAVIATSNRYQGVVNFCQGIPVLLLTLFAGVVIDRVNKRRLLLTTQLGFMACAASVGILIRLGLIRIEHVMFFALAVGVLLAFDMPTRQSFVVEMVGKKDLPSAVALNSSLFNAARAIGPAVAGLLLAAHVSLATCFLLNAASSTFVILGLALMRGKHLGDPPTVNVAHANQNVIDNLKAGFHYVWHNHTTRNVLLLVCGLGTFAFSFNVLIPTFVRYSLLPLASNAVQVKAFGFLETVRGVGALAAAISVALITKPNRYKWNLIAGGLVSNILLMAFAWERNLTASYLTMAIVTAGTVLIFASANTVMQMTVPDNLRGRVMAIYTLVFIGTGPIGSLLAGLIAQYVGAPWTIFGFGALTTVIVALVSFRPGGLATIRFGEGAPAIAHAKT